MSNNPSDHLYFPPPRVPSHIVKTPNKKAMQFPTVRLGTPAVTGSGKENQMPFKSPLAKVMTQQKKIYTPRKVDLKDLEQVERKLAQMEMAETEPVIVKTEEPVVYAGEYGSMAEVQQEFETKIATAIQLTAMQQKEVFKYIQHVVNKMQVERPDIKEEEIVVKQESNSSPIKSIEVIDLTRDFPQSQDPSELKKMVVRDVDGAFVTAYTPIRVNKKKERDLIGADYAVSPVRRSARKLPPNNDNELLDKQEQLEDKQKEVAELLGEYGYAFAPNSFLPDKK